MNLPDIQAALRDEGLDGWLFFDHHHRDPLAYRILGLSTSHLASRRWYYFIPAAGEPKALVHRIESAALDALPGPKRIYSGWGAQVDGLRYLLNGCFRVAMQYSPNCAVPYVSMVDGGTIELIRGLGVEISTSANLIQLFEARWSAEQLESHLEAGRRVDQVRAEAFEYIGDALRAGHAITEWDVNRFIRSGFGAMGLFTDHGPIVAVNANMSDPHYVPAETGSVRIHAGDSVLIDMFARLDLPGSVFYDITWTGYCGAAIPSEVAAIFSIVTGARDAAIERVQSAVARKEKLRGFEVDDAARGYIRERGYADYFVHRTGHSIGEEIHGTGANMDNLETHDERPVIARTCFSIEPGVYLPKFGIRSEVNVYVGESEAIVTGEMQQEMVRILP